MRAQARLDHARNGQAAKQAARDAAATRKTDVEDELQVGRLAAACRGRLDLLPCFPPRCLFGCTRGYDLHQT